MPISLNMVEQRLKNLQYETMELLEGDLKRLVQNAKEYNDSRSEVFLDAERIRKALSNFMPKHNPAYANPEYRAVPTPIPQSMLERLRESSVSTSGSGLPVKLKFKASRQSAPPSATPEAEDLNSSFMELLEELSVQENAVNFEKKPPKRDYPDYYQVIERPTSIADVKALVRQNKIADWNELAREGRLIWSNAKEYNEPGSAIYQMAEDLEDWFEEKVQAAGADSPKAPQRLSLSQPKKLGLKLKVGGATPTPSFSGGSVDNDALRRQKQETQQALRASRGGSKSFATPAPSDAPSVARSLSSVEPNGDVIMAGTNGMGSATPSLAPEAIAQKPAAALLNGLQPGQMNGVRTADPLRNVLSVSDNPMERKHRDADKGKQKLLEVVWKCNAVLTSARTRRCTPGQCYLYDPSYDTWRPEMEATGRCFSYHDADFLLHIPPCITLLLSRCPDIHTRDQVEKQLENLCFGELAVNTGEPSHSRILRLPASAR